MILMIGTLLPITLAAALSTVPFVAMIILLLSPQRTRTGLPFLIGYVVGFFVVAGFFAFTISALPPRTQFGPFIGGLEVAVGGILIVLAFVQRRWARGRTPKPESAWTKRVEKFGPMTALGFALLINIRPKALLLAAAAGVAISTASHGLTEATIGIGFYTLFGTSTVTVPIILTLFRPGPMSAWLRRARLWIERNGDVMTFVVLLMVGTVILADGLIRLGS